MEVGTNLRSSDEFTSTNQHPSSAHRGSTSKFRGVLRLKSGKWGTRISFKYKPYWLGTYDAEEEAAMAYDRAAIKLQRSDLPLNFPMSVYTIRETKFQSLFSSEDILIMLKDKTYQSKFVYYLASQSSARDCEAPVLAKQGGISYQILFRKELTQTDVAHVKGFHIPKEYAKGYFPQLAGANAGGEENGSKSIELTFHDKHLRPWTFRYSYRKSTQTFVFTKGWRHFLKMNNLRPRDIVLFYRGAYQGEQEKAFYMIDIHRNSADMRQQVNIGVDAGNMQDGKANNGVKLFGVQIGERRSKRPFLELL